MKALLAIVCFSLTTFAFADELAQPELVDVPVGKVFTPVGFDDNDISQVVIAGQFANTCYQVGPHFFNVDHDEKKITIHQHAYLYNGICLQVSVPFYEVIDVGILRVGGYEIVDSVSGTKLGTLGVAKAKNPGPGPDNYAYAPVSDAYVVKDGVTGGQKLILKGTWTNRCMRMKKVQLNYDADVIVVLPVMEMIEPEDGGCESTLTRYQREVPLGDLKEHAYLIHVRSMNGKAVNRIWDGRTNP